MSLSTISRAAADSDLVSRVTSAAYKIANTDADKANTVLGQALITGSGLGSVGVLMYPVAIETEAAYETALVSGRGAPGFDKDIITDAALETAVGNAWPMVLPPDLPPIP